MSKLKGLLVTAALLLSTSLSVAAGEFGTADEAKAMLAKAVESIKADEAAALVDLQKGGPGSRDRDLYVFCGQADTGVMTVHPTLVGRKVQEFVDKNGKKFGEEIMMSAKPDAVVEVSYFWPRPGADTTPVEKISFVTKVASQICGVGYYK
jgi:signal transduction histidine kinase